MADTGTLSAKQKKAIAALLTAGTVARAAKVCRIGERTIFRWLNEDETFKAELQRAGDELIGATVRQLSDAAGLAVITLRTIITDRAAPSGSRVRASAVVLGSMLRVKEQLDLEQRIAALEAAVKGGT